MLISRVTEKALVLNEDKSLIANSLLREVKVL